MRRSLRLLCSLPLVLAACRGSGGTPPAAPDPVPPSHPFAALASQQVIVAPAHSLREVDPMGWTKQVPRSRELLRQLDDEIAKELAARGISHQWIFPADLVRAAKASPAYGQDPYTLAADGLRSGHDVAAGGSVGSPMIMQLRTMVAMQENARAVLLPVELRFERDSTAGQGVAVLRLALLDGRLGEVRWIGDVRSDPSRTFSRDTLLVSVAAHLADLIAAR